MNKYNFTDDEILEMGQILENLKSLSGEAKHQIRAAQSYRARHPGCETPRAVALMHTAMDEFQKELL
jgi:hypothetical protein